jgi:WD40 repeat protein
MKKLYLSIFPLVLISFLHGQEFQLIDTWKKNPSPIEFIVLSPEGDKVFVGHHDGALALWDIHKKMMVAEYHAHRDLIQTIIFNKDKTRFVTASFDQKIIIWEYPSMKILKTFHTSEDMNAFAVLTPDGNSIFYGGYYRNVRYDYSVPFTAIYKIDVKSGAQAVMYDPNNKASINYGGLTDGDFDISGEHVVISFEDKLLYYNWKTAKIDKKIACDHDLNNFIFHNDKIYLWGDKYLMRMEMMDGKYQVTHTVLAGTHDAYNGYSDMAVTSDGKILVSGDDDNNINVWDAESMIKKQILFGHEAEVRTFLFCQQDTVLISGGYDGQLKIWSYVKKKEDPKQENENTEVIFAENNIPLVIKDRGVDLQSNLPVSESEFDIQIWDKAVEDGDSISLNLNGEWILKDHLVTRSKKKVHVKLNTLFSNNYLILYAHNLGSIPPNTAAVAVLIGGKEVILSLSSDMKKSGALNFEYKP